MLGEILHHAGLLFRFEFPNTDCAVSTDADEELAVRRIGDGVDPIALFLVLFPNAVGFEFDEGRIGNEGLFLRLGFDFFFFRIDFLVFLFNVDFLRIVLLARLLWRRPS